MNPQESGGTSFLTEAMPRVNILMDTGWMLTDGMLKAVMALGRRMPRAGGIRMLPGILRVSGLR